MAAMAGLGTVAAPGDLLSQYRFLDPVRVPNPLQQYPNRDWERIYRDIFRHDRTFTFLCAPNDTHNCLLKGFVKNGVLVRIEPTYGYGKATDLSGNRASARWDPRCCQKGLVLGRRLYGDRRVKGAVVRKGFKEWAEKGFPRDPQTGRAPAELMKRGWDGFVRVPYAEAYALHARALENITRTYTGDQGKRYLLAQGYDPAMVEAMSGAGIRTLKFRGGMAKLGITRIVGTYRMANMAALLDAHVRGVGPDRALGGGLWDSYSWHTDLPPGHPMVHGDQTSEFELFDAENARLIIVWGMNWITTKMPDSHWLTEARLKGTKVVVLTVEYSATANKGDEVIVIRPGTDPAFALGLASVIVGEKLYDVDFVKRYTDLPRLVRMDTLDPLLARDVFPGYKEAELSNWVHVLKTGERAVPTIVQNGMQMPEAMRGEFADFVMWDAKTGRPVAVSRDQMGERFATAGIDPALEGTFEVTLADGKKVQARPVFDLTRQYLAETMTAEAVSKITWAPQAAIESLARQIAAARGKTLFPVGMGPNQFFNNDLKDRAIFLVAALTGNIGENGGNVGSYAGNTGRRSSRACRSTCRGSVQPAAGPRRAGDHAVVLSGRVDPLLRGRRSRSSGRHQAVHDRAPRAHADQGDLVVQLELTDRQHQVPLQRGVQHAAQAGVRGGQRVVVVGLLRVRGHRVRRGLVDGVQVPGHDGVEHESVSADLSKNAAATQLRHGERPRYLCRRQRRPRRADRRASLR
jgi:nitrate reductase alpha subunit